jgi:PncC family amidohydrolase
MVTYSNEMKVRWLGVAEQTLKLYGAVSEQVAIEMAQGVLQRAESTFALAVTGIAGPTGATPDKPIGMVCGAIAQIGAPTYAFTFHCPGDRKAVITASTGKMLNALLHSAQQRSAVSQ